jgi:hypothetical protein
MAPENPFWNKTPIQTREPDLVPKGLPMRFPLAISGKHPGYNQLIFLDKKSSWPISGYPMAVVAGGVFFAVRALLALIPGLTVSFPGQEMGRGGRTVRRDLLSPAVGRRGCDPALVPDDGGGLDRVMVDRRAVWRRSEITPYKSAHPDKGEVMGAEAARVKNQRAELEVTADTGRTD